MTALEKALFAELESKKELENKIASLTSENERLTSENEGLTKALEELKNEKQQSVSELNPSLKESLKQSLASELKQELENDDKNSTTELVEELKELVKNLVKSSRKDLEDMHKQGMNSLKTQENAEQKESETKLQNLEDKLTECTETLNSLKSNIITADEATKLEDFLTNSSNILEEFAKVTQKIKSQL